jgi:hypothetical protein
MDRLAQRLANSRTRWRRFKVNGWYGRTERLLQIVSGTALQEQLGSAEKTTNTLAARIREVMPDVHTAYPHANVELTSHGLLLKPSPPAVPRTTVNGFRLGDE